MIFRFGIYIFLGLVFYLDIGMVWGVVERDERRNLKFCLGRDKFEMLISF